MTALDRSNCCLVIWRASKAFTDFYVIIAGLIVTILTVGVTAIIKNKFYGIQWYQKKSRQTAVYLVIGQGVYPALGIAGESGEVVEKIKKIFRDQQGIVSTEQRQAVAKELGDVLWYLAQLATELDLELNQVAQDNLDKLLSRQQRDQLHGSGDNR